MLADILGYYAKSPTSIGSFKVDIVKSVEYTYEQEVTSHPIETGFEIHDTIVNKPMRLKLTVGVSTMPVTWYWNNGAERTKFQDGYEALKAIREAKQPVTIVRPDRIYTDMVLTACRSVNDGESMSVKMIDLEFVKITKVDTKTVEIPQNIVEPSKADKVGETAADGGNANQTETPQGEQDKLKGEAGKSMLSTLWDFFFGG